MSTDAVVDALSTNSPNGASGRYEPELADSFGAPRAYPRLRTDERFRSKSAAGGRTPCGSSVIRMRWWAIDRFSGRRGGNSTNTLPARKLVGFPPACSVYHPCIKPSGTGSESAVRGREHRSEWVLVPVTYRSDSPMVGSTPTSFRHTAAFRIIILE